MANTCPCCRSAGALVDEDDVLRCGACGHGWHPEPFLPVNHYAENSGRNPPAPWLARKYSDRLTDIGPLLRDGMRILEIGCADGHLGALVKQRAVVDYVGVELSRDADQASRCLDHVHRQPAAAIRETAFDLVLAFHVLEHIADIGNELAHWKRLMGAESRLIVEVPHRAGHPLLRLDRHPEHLHHFSASSLTAALETAGFTIVRLATGHFESPVHCDGLRIEAKPALSDEAKTRALLDRFRAELPGPFVIHGLGGDFHNYVAPLVDALPVVALCDSDPGLHGKPWGGRIVTAYDPAALAGLPVLVASLRYAEAIRRQLLALGVPAEAIVPLERIYG